MKRSLILCLLTLLGATVLQAESIKMKDGTIISGSILEQTQYTLNLATSFGTVTLNQKEIEQILPDKHRILLKGGTQLVGVIVDLDEFNLKLQTDDGIVNIDMPQIANIEVYDYDQAPKTQQTYVEQKIETAQEEKARQAQVAQTGAVQAAGGLAFDSDIDKVFDTQKATVVNGQAVSAVPTVSAAPVAPRPLTDEEAFLKGVKTGAVSQQQYAAQAKDSLSAQKPAAKKENKPQAKEKDFRTYLAIQLGAMPLDLKLNVSERPGFSAEKEAKDVGGTSVVASGKFLWRLMDSNLWLGPNLSIANIANNTFDDLDPDTLAATDSTGAPLYPDPKIKTSGQFISLGVSANYYLNPKSRVVFYLTGNAGYEMLTLNYRGEMKSDSIKSNGFSAGGGLGVETRVDDLMLGAEVRQQFSTRSNELKDSATSNTVFTAQVSWKFQ